MDSLILWIVAFTALGGVLSVFAAAGFLLLPADMRTRLLSPLVSFAIGTMSSLRSRKDGISITTRPRRW